MPPERVEHPGVRFPPPLLFVGGFGLGWLIERWRSFGLLGEPGPIASTIGGLLLGSGLGVMLWALLTFHRHRTAIYPNRPATRLVTNGPYARSRNPMYVGLTAAYLGLAVVTGMVWPVILLPIVLGLLSALVIRREERYLGGAFPDEYASYRGRVRRWL